MAKKRNKRYNPLKIATTAAKSGMRGLVITFNAEDEECKVYNYKTERFEVVTRSMFNAIWKIRYKWQLFLCARIKEKNGKEATPYMEVIAPFEVYHDEINESLSGAHAEFLEEEKAKGNEIVNVGWIASYETLDLDLNQVKSIQTAIGL